jgi:cation-dependent mannose-6-phosphate receptor
LRLQEADQYLYEQDMFIILFSSLGSICHINRSRSNSGYMRADTDGGRGGVIGAIGGRGGRGQGRDVDAENRLIDQLDEEWDD